jgi:hypothetical protein
VQQQNLPRLVPGAASRVRWARHSRARAQCAYPAPVMDTGQARESRTVPVRCGRALTVCLPAAPGQQGSRSESADGRQTVTEKGGQGEGAFRRGTDSDQDGMVQHGPGDQGPGSCIQQRRRGPGASVGVSATVPVDCEPSRRLDAQVEAGLRSRAQADTRPSEEESRARAGHSTLLGLWSSVVSPTPEPRVASCLPGHKTEPEGAWYRDPLGGAATRYFQGGPE